MTKMKPPGVAAGGLASDPLFQLSTAGQELFHTNMLFWLATEHPAESAAVWELLGVDAPTGVESAVYVKREWRHLDLVIDSGMPGRKLVLENKVQAIPTAVQLIGYRDEIARNPPKSPPLVSDEWTTSWRLLTLLSPSFQMPAPWEVVTYDDLGAALQTTAERLVGFDAGLVSAYSNLVVKLTAFRDEVDREGSWNAAFQLPTRVRSAFAEARLASLAEKIRISRLGEMVSERIHRTFMDQLPEPGIGLSNTHGSMTWLMPLDGLRKRQVGWQYQGGQFRLVLLTDPAGTSAASRLRREEVAETTFAEFFDFGSLGHADVLGHYAGTKNWLGYSPDFVYRYRPVETNATWTELADLCLAASRHTVEFINSVGKRESSR